MRLLVLVLGLLAVDVDAAPVYRPHMTGEQLVRDMRADPAIGFNSMRRQRAMGYIDGVMDVSAGVRWCPAGASIPHELNYVLVESMEKSARLDPAQLKANAAALIIAALAKEYPCDARGANP